MCVVQRESKVLFLDSQSGSDRFTGTEDFIYKLNYTIKSFASVHNYS